MQTVGVIGASGFVGSTFVETLRDSPDFQIRPFIHSSGNAWRLARHGIDLHSIDLMSPETLASAIDGCSHIVNCSRGPAEVMIKGLSNLLEACRQTGVERFVHLSSVAVYTPPFPSEPIKESFGQHASKGTYGGNKIAQDQLVLEAQRKGLSSVVLCPPNITGPYSTFLINFVQLMRSGRLGLVEEGIAPCVMVDVRNLVHAMTLALSVESADGQRIFVTDDEEVSWGRLAEGLADVAGVRDGFPTISLDQATGMTAAKSKPRKSLVGAVKHLVSGDVRDVLRRDPLIGSAEEIAKTFAKSLPGKIQQRLKASAGDKPASVSSSAPKTNLDTGMISQQLRNVRYDIGRARESLGYQPVVKYEESLQAFRNWYAAFFDWGSDQWELFEKLYYV